MKSFLYDRPIAFQRIFVDMTQNIAAALMLSQACYWTGIQAKEGKGLWFYKKQKDWEEETGLGRREQETARKILKSLGLIEEEKRGVPCTVYFRVNVENLEKTIEQVELARQRRKAKEAELECAKAPNQNGGKRQTEMAESANLLITETTTETTADIPSDFSLSGEPAGIAKAPKSKKLEKPKDPRHRDSMEALAAYWDWVNEDELEGKCPFSGRTAGEVAKFLKANPKLTTDDFRNCLQNRGDSEGIPPTEDPVFWIKTLLKFQAGPLNKYGRLRDGPPKK